MLKIGDVLTNDELASHFKCGTQGGMRRSHKTNSLVLVSNHLKSLYDDRWIGESFHYTGMGTKGDQSINFMQNKTLNESNNNGVNVYLFEVFEANKYIYIGKVILNASPYVEEQLDIDNIARKVVVFPLSLESGAIPNLNQNVISDLNIKKEKKAKTLSNDDLKIKANSVKRKSGSRQVIGIQYERNPIISEYAKRRANGICQLCNESAPFLNSKKEPYLETHHIIWLAKGGFDTIENTVALCPNCHRKMHILNLNIDIEYLSTKNEASIL